MQTPANAASRRIACLLMTLPLMVLLGYRAGKELKFDRECGGHLKRAADANSVEMAVEELRTAVAYLDERGMTAGNTAIIYQTPADDVGYWHRNLKGALDDLEALPADASPMVRSNLLMKLRETLLDHGSDGENLTTPGGIAVAPHNRSIALGYFVFSLLLAAGWWIGWKARRMQLKHLIILGSAATAAFGISFFVFLT